jgi:Ring finger domain
METFDPSNNNYTHRRYNHQRVHLTNEHHVETDDDTHERFNMNQYYNAVEDEQLYMDEYTSLIHRYNDFIVNSTTLYSRMEQTLRENIARAVSRQSYYYLQSDELYRREIRRGTQYRSPVRSPSLSNAGQGQDRTPDQRFRDVLPRLITRYISTENAREQRAHNNNNNNNNNNHNLFSMLYTFPFEARVGQRMPAGGVGASESSVNGAPTNEQINRATLNTVFSNILSPVNATCPISRDEFNDESEITMIRGCNHIFNRVSLREWFVSHSTCPMCRRDIREYRPPSLQEPSRDSIPHSTIPRNISIDSFDRDHVTFSYDLPSMNGEGEANANQEMYRHLINTVATMLSNRENNNEPRNHDHHDHHDHDDDDIMEVD